MDFHSLNHIPASQFVLFLKKHLEAFVNTKLDGVDWESIPSLFTWAGHLWATMINVNLVVESWTSSFDDHFVPGGKLVHNLALCLMLSPNTNKDFQVEYGPFQWHVLSVVVIYVLMTQRQCSLLQAVEWLAPLGKSQESGLVFICISHNVPYIPSLADADKIDYAVIPAHCDLMKDFGCFENFPPGHLLCLEGANRQIHIVPPLAFRHDPKAMSVLYVPENLEGQCG